LKKRACCNIAGLDTPHKRFFKRLIVGGSLFALGSFLIQKAAERKQAAADNQAFEEAFMRGIQTGDIATGGNNIAGLDTPHKRFFKRLIVGGSLFALGSFLIQWLTQDPQQQRQGEQNQRQRNGVLRQPLNQKAAERKQAAATLSLIGRMPIYVPPLLYIGGTLWYGLFNWFWFWLPI
jgi:uncharacterized membrane protein YccC